MITEEENNYINNELKPYGYAINCFSCDTCEEYSDGKNPYHIERVILRD